MPSCVILLACFVLLGLAQNIRSDETFTDPSCSRIETRATYVDEFCNATACAMVAPGFYIRTRCDSTPISVLPGPSVRIVKGITCAAPTASNLILQTSHDTPRSCELMTLELANTFNTYLLTDIPTDGSVLSFWYECIASEMVVVTFSDNRCRAGRQEVPANIGVNACVVFPFNAEEISTFLSICTPACFHESTVITYKDSEFSLEDLQGGKEAECTVPHVVPMTSGFKLRANCSNREDKELILSSGHLVYTERGLLPVKQVTTSDLVFGDLNQGDACNVIDIAPVGKMEHYFGLNCHQSQVLANGVKTSTFEYFHVIPEWWMSVLAKLIGIERASALGVYMDEWLLRMNLKPLL